MKKMFLVFGLIAALFSLPSFARAENKSEDDDPPAVQLKLEKDRIVLNYEDKSYFYPLNNLEGIKQTDTTFMRNGGKKGEYIIGAQLYHNNDEPRGIVLICEQDEKGLSILKEIETGEHFIKFEFKITGYVGKEKTWLLIWGESGAHSDSLQIIVFQNNEFVTLLDKASSAGLDYKRSEEGVPQVWVGRENWDDPDWNYATGKRLWEVHVWNAKEFVYDKALSTSPDETEYQKIGGYKKYLEDQAKKQGQAKNDAKQKD